MANATSTLGAQLCVWYAGSLLAPSGVQLMLRATSQLLLPARKWDGLLAPVPTVIVLPALGERVHTVAGPGGHQINEEVRSILYVTLQGYMRQDRRTPVWGNLHNGNRDRLRHLRSPNPLELFVGERGMGA